ncbi:hypothetical protein RFI_04686, partial [Reticulomyxa filosa]
LRVYFLLDVCLGGELFTILRQKRYFNEPTSKFYTACVVEAFDYMHSMDIIYRDLKPENLVLDSDGYLKVTDFGFAKVCPDKTYTLCGTPDYLCPEIVTGQGHGKGVDWWTLGILIYEMLASFPPFVADDPVDTYRKIVRGKIRFPKYFSQEARDLIRALLHHKPNRRLACLHGGTENIRKHAWFKGFKWGCLARRKNSCSNCQPSFEKKNLLCVTTKTYQTLLKLMLALTMQNPSLLKKNLIKNFKSCSLRLHVWLLSHLFTFVKDFFFYKHLFFIRLIGFNLNKNFRLQAFFPQKLRVITLQKLTYMEMQGANFDLKRFEIWKMKLYGGMQNEPKEAETKETTNDSQSSNDKRYERELKVLMLLCNNVMTKEQLKQKLEEKDGHVSSIIEDIVSKFLQQPVFI